MLNRCRCFAFVMVVAVVALPIAKAHSFQSSREFVGSNSAEIFFSLLIDDSLDLTYFLDELTIIGEQRKDIKRIADQELKRWLSLMSEIQQSLPAGTARLSPEHERDLSSFHSELGELVDSVLLPHQTQKIRYLLVQRNILKTLDCEAFEIFPELRDLPQSNSQERTEFLEELRQLQDEFYNDKEELFQEAWETIESKIPQKSAQELTELWGILNTKSETHRTPEQPDFTALDAWTEDDFDHFEQRRIQNYVYDLPNNESLQGMFGIHDNQLQVIQDILIRGPLVTSEPLHFDREKAMAMAAVGDVQGLKNLHKEHVAGTYRFQQSMIDDIFDNVLLPFQASLIRSAARFQRLTYESKYGDQFGAIVAWTRAFGDSKSNIADLVEIVEQSRDKYYKRLSEIRERTCTRAIDALPSVARDKFSETYGELYDYQSEKVSAWNSLRESAKK